MMTSEEQTSLNAVNTRLTQFMESRFDRDKEMRVWLRWAIGLLAVSLLAAAGNAFNTIVQSRINTAAITVTTQNVSSVAKDVKNIDDAVDDLKREQAVLAVTVTGAVERIQRMEDRPYTGSSGRSPYSNSQEQ